jgi:hypothetical protein
LNAYPAAFRSSAFCSEGLRSLVCARTCGPAGMRVQPGAPEQSSLFLAMSDAQCIAELEPMPPIGVQRRDEQAIDLLRDWITALPH